jgi:hypothetical protein
VLPDTLVLGLEKTVMIQKNGCIYQTHINITNVQDANWVNGGSESGASIRNAIVTLNTFVDEVLGDNYGSSSHILNAP